MIHKIQLVEKIKDGNNLLKKLRNKSRQRSENYGVTIVQRTIIKYALDTSVREAINRTSMLSEHD